ncbi:Protein YIF1B [Trichoplax sp. H2]|nr:Protein YIF1B [Trichoplax sp. H2]|eukprot:RDD37312.1 Protein YIF1B [Trichoplax sp. H2]
MDPPLNYDNVHHRSQYPDNTGSSEYYNPVNSQQFFDDTSGQGNYRGDANSPPPSTVPNKMFTDPLASMALQYGSNIATSGQEYVNSNFARFIPVTSLKYYFAVDNSYVFRKLLLLLLPYAHTDWSIRYAKSEPVAPRHEINAPDLYIPLMAFVTYVIISGLVLGVQDKFSPEHLGIIASTAFVMEFLAVCLIFVTLYFMNINSAIKTFDLIAFFGYKYVGMIFCIVIGVLTNSLGYYCTLGWTGLAVSFFLVRTLRLVISQEATSNVMGPVGKKRIYVLIMIALLQPIIMYWLTYQFIK